MIYNTNLVLKTYDLTIKAIKGFYKIKTLTIEEIRKCKRYGEEFIDTLQKYTFMKIFLYQ